jgi:hypothetical protein
LSLSSQKYGFGIRDPEKTYSGFRISDPGVKKAPDPGSLIPDPGSGSATLTATTAKRSGKVNFLANIRRKIIRWKTTSCLATPLQHNYVREVRDAALITKTKKTKGND